VGEEQLPAESTAVILARMEVKLDTALATGTDHEVRLRSLEVHTDPRVSDHETRIRGLEHAKWLLVGFAAALGGSAGAVVSKFVGG
jgi:hypothetical protein